MVLLWRRALCTYTFDTGFYNGFLQLVEPVRPEGYRSRTTEVVEAHGNPHAMQTAAIGMYRERQQQE